MSNNYFRFKEFIIYQDNCGMKVNTDSVLLGCYTNPGNARNILDVGTGTGLLAIQLSFETSSPIVAIEIDHQAYEQACSNVAINHKEHQITVINEDFNKYNPSCKFDLIICNPPYFETGSPTRSEKRNVARYTGNLTHEDLISRSKELLSDSGILAVCLPFQAAEHIKNTSDSTSFKLVKNVYVFPKEKKDCYLELLFWQNNKEPNAEIPLTESLTIRAKDNSYTDEYKNKTKKLYLAF